MIIMPLQALLFSVPGRFKIATSDTRFSHHLVTGLAVGEIQGWGSGVLYGARPLETAALLREQVLPFLRDTDFSDFSAARREIKKRFARRDPSLVFALDSALWDLEGKTAGQPVNQLLGTPQRAGIPITEQVFIQNESQAGGEIREILGHGTRSIKVKIGLDPKSDAKQVARVREQVGNQVEIHVDANGGYNFNQAVAIGKQLKTSGVSVFEDPLPVKDWAKIPALREATGLAVMQDAGVRSMDDLERVAHLGAADLLNLKLTRIGGLTAALELAQSCHQAGIHLAVGCSEDLGMGMASILHLASILPESSSTEGVGSYRLGFDLIAEPFQIEGCLRSRPVPA
jgi:L-alanine-DL-glutamate epimerase-like enolase superfamily enzyme